ncbi:MAG: hypothetical protein RBS91_04370 [Sulfurimonadaceae bacterium]|jgi:hypothetical protein|nr:hypothetical protein [Sulfurimonadaceae bacterium]
MKILKIFLILCSIIISLNASDKVKFKQMYKNLDYLNLNRMQSESIKKSLINLKDEYKEFFDFKEKLEDNLKNIIKNENFNEELYHKELMKLKTKAATLETKRIKIIYEVLDKEQREHFAKHFREWEIE